MSSLISLYVSSYVIDQFSVIPIDRRGFLFFFQKLDLLIIFTSEWYFSKKLKVKYECYEHQDTIFPPFCLTNPP